MNDEIAKAIRELAEATKKNAELFDRLWTALPPRTRAQMLGVSTRTERNRRKAAEIKKAAGL